MRSSGLDVVYSPVLPLTSAPSVTLTHCALKSIVGGQSKPQIGDARGSLVDIVFYSRSAEIFPKEREQQLRTTATLFQQRKISAGPWSPLSVRLFSSGTAKPIVSELKVERLLSGTLFAFFAFVQKLICFEWFSTLQECIS